MSDEKPVPSSTPGEAGGLTKGEREVLGNIRRLASEASGPWRSMREGNQYLDGRSSATLVGASRVDGLRRPWSAHFVKPAIEMETVSRFTNADADYIEAVQPSQILRLLALIDRLTAVSVTPPVDRGAGMREPKDGRVLVCEFCIKPIRDGNMGGPKCWAHGTVAGKLIDPTAPYYLVERNDRGRAEWLKWAGFARIDWTTDAGEADRYEYKLDADKNIRIWADAWGIALAATEHVDMPPPSDPPQRDRGGARLCSGGCEAVDCNNYCARQLDHDGLHRCQDHGSITADGEGVAPAPAPLGVAPGPVRGPVAKQERCEIPGCHNLCIHIREVYVCNDHRYRPVAVSSPLVDEGRPRETEALRLLRLAVGHIKSYATSTQRNGDGPSPWSATIAFLANTKVEAFLGAAPAPSATGGAT